MSWIVVKEFADKTDSYYVYKAGETFPRHGKHVSAERISELSSGENAIKTPFIKEEKKQEGKSEETEKPKKTANKSKKKKG